MSEALFNLGGLRFWHEHEIERRDAFIRAASTAMRGALGPTFAMHRCEGPILHPRSQISAAYDDSDIFVTNDIRGGEPLCLRAETTPSSYAYARWLVKQRKSAVPLCVWQAGISSRRETNDGASAAKLRFNSFWQLEFQCIVPASAKTNNMRRDLMAAVERVIKRFTTQRTGTLESDRLPSYSESTIDIEAWHPSRNEWREVASCSIRTDFSDDTRVVEIAIGLDRIVAISEDMA